MNNFLFVHLFINMNFGSQKYIAAVATAAHTLERYSIIPIRTEVHTRGAQQETETVSVCAREGEQARDRHFEFIKLIKI